MPDPEPAPVVVYDIERQQSRSSSTANAPPPDIDAILRRKRHWGRRLLYLDFPRPVQAVLTCVSIATSALQANGVYCWGTYGPVVARKLQLDGTEAQTIVVGGILGVYLMAAPLGALTDRYGPRVGSFVSACLSAAGYLSFSILLTKADPDTPFLYLYLTAAYFLVGAATVGSYFACLTCASLSFPRHPTLSLSLPLSLIGLSALVISSFSSLRIFISRETHDLDPAKFLYFLGVLSPIVNLLGAVFMRVLPQPLPVDGETGEGGEGEGEEDAPGSPISALLHLDEHTPLLIGGPEAAREELEEAGGKEVKWGIRELVADWKGFWLFGILCALVIGPGEMVIASIGSILTSLLPTPTSLLSLLTLSSTTTSTPHNPLALRNKHVHLLSISSTLARLITGVLADYLSPAPTPFPNPAHRTDPSKPSHVFKQVKKIRLTRSAFTGVCAGVLGAVFAGCAAWLSGEAGLGWLSVGVGGMYGALFTLTPAIVSHHFGPTNFGLAWGMISYFAALGSVVYSYLYALLSTPGVEAECHGVHCFQATFVVCAVSCAVGGVGLAILGRRWRV
ncbi:hypothetical protein IAT38_005007 [Cryptococcus sp. DSM 104549]